MTNTDVDNNEVERVRVGPSNHLATEFAELKKSHESLPRGQENQWRTPNYWRPTESSLGQGRGNRRRASRGRHRRDTLKSFYSNLGIEKKEAE